MIEKRLPKEIMDAIEAESEKYASDHFARGRQDKHNCKRDYQFAAIHYSLHYFLKIVEKDLKIQELSDELGRDYAYWKLEAKAKSKELEKVLADMSILIEKESEAWKFFYAAKKRFDELIEQLKEQMKINVFGDTI